MRLTVVGGCGAWPAAGQACSGYLVEQNGFQLLIDPGYAIVPRLLERIDAAQIDAVLVSHSHPDHCADLHPLLRARALREEPAPALPVHSLPRRVPPTTCPAPGRRAGTPPERESAGCC
jgi:ribonuclease BN (tRNA processing enzyme)